MYDTSPNIASLISARICHDIASPLGAIANGLELLELSGIADLPETLLIGDSVASATARVEYFRLAYGTAGADSFVGMQKARKTMTGYFTEKKITADWAITTDVPRPMAKLIFLLAQSAETAMPYGGEIRITDDGENYQMVCTAREIRTKPDLWDFLASCAPEPALHSSQVQFALARLQAQFLGVAVTYHATDETLTVTIR